MSPTLRKLPGRSAESGMYAISGSLDGLHPGRRVVRQLEIRQLSGDTKEGLQPLTSFPHLTALTLDRVRNVDLSPLQQVELEHLQLRSAHGVDLSPLQRIDGLRSLVAMDIHGCPIPEQLVLPPTVETLALSNDAPKLTGQPIRDLLEAVQWQRLRGLRELGLRVGGNEQIASIYVDLGFLENLSQLEDLDLPGGVWHKGERSSPLEPPFHGLPRSLKRVRLRAWEPDRIRSALREHLGQADITVYQRYDEPADAASWAISPPPGPDDPAWSTLGSLYEALDGRDGARELHTEFDAVKAVQRRLRVADASLLERLDFDHDSSSTLITARSRKDLDAALHILGIR